MQLYHTRRWESPTEITLEKDLVEDLRIDEVGEMIELILELEEQFDLALIEAAYTIADIVDFLKSQGLTDSGDRVPVYIRG